MKWVKTQWCSQPKILGPCPPGYAYVKTWLCSAMTSDHLSDLCVLHCHRERINEVKINRLVMSLGGGKQLMNF